MNARSPRRRFLAPEVVQTSSMDCGPAALACLLQGFGIRASYGRLREACQTDVDGTSIDTVEEAAVALGLAAEQLLVPFEHLLLPTAEILPALVVVNHASGARHFLVAWRRVGAWVQVMDPSVGRRWLRARVLANQVYAHSMPVTASTWRTWMAHPFHRAPLEARLERLGFPRAEARARIEASLAEAHWKPAAALQASVSLTERLVGARALGRGSEARRMLDELHRHACGEDPRASAHVPAPFWPVQPVAPVPVPEGAPPAEPLLLVTGAVVVRVRGRRAVAERSARASIAGQTERPEPPPLSPELAAALEEAPARPLRELWSLLRQDGALAPAVVLAALVGASAAVFVQTLLFRGLLTLSGELGSEFARLGAAGVLLAFFGGLLALELALTSTLVRLGRHLEGRMRVLFQAKLPRLGDRYFQSRPAADMTERVNAGTALRGTPALAAQFLRTLFGLALTTAGLAWVAPETAPWALAGALLAVALPLVTQRSLGERELRARSQRASLGRFYLDAMLGLVAVRTHGAERAVRREHEALLTEWVRASRRFLRAAVAVDALGALLGQALALAIVAVHVAPFLAAEGAAAAPPGLLLVCFWALALPAQGQALATLAQQLPAQRNVALRLLEPLGAPEDALATPSPGGAHERATIPAPTANDPAPVDAAALETRTSLRAAGPHATHATLATIAPAIAAPAPTRSEPGVELVWRAVSVVAAGRTILSEVELHVAPGEHVAIVGRSGAGKSSLLGLLLGWHRAASGELTVDGARLDGATLAALRRVTTWVDPSVQIWNRPLLANLAYGNAPAAADEVSDAPPALGAVLRGARLEGLLAALPAGLATPLGQGGGLVSGGEGQRVRLGRALGRGGVRLALLDEPFCGLDRATRRALLAEARQRWRAATLLCVTHDVTDTLDFERVLVVEAGRVVEVGAPRELARRIGSPYRALLEAEERARREVWGAAHWQRWHVADGKVRRVDPPDGRDA